MRKTQFERYWPKIELLMEMSFCNEALYIHPNEPPKRFKSGFDGGGDAAVKELEQRLGFTLPEELRFYVHNICDDGVSVSDAQIAEHYGDVSNIHYTKLGTSEIQGYYELEEENTAHPESFFLAVMDDLETGFIIDARDPACPLYILDSSYQELEYAAPSFAVGFYLLVYSDYLCKDAKLSDAQRRFMFIRMLSNELPNWQDPERYRMWREHSQSLSSYYD